MTEAGRGDAELMKRILPYSLIAIRYSLDTGAI